MKSNKTPEKSKIGKSKDKTPNSENIDKQAISDDQVATQFKFPAKLSFYSQLFSRSSCPQEQPIIGITGPLKCSEFKKASQ